MVKNLKIGELNSLTMIVNALDDRIRCSILKDIATSIARPLRPDRSIIEFDISGYIRPESRLGQKPLPVEGEVYDSDGQKLTVVVYSDSNGRLFEMEIIRYAEGNVLDPDWRTFQLID